MVTFIPVSLLTKQHATVQWMYETFLNYLAFHCSYFKYYFFKKNVLVSHRNSPGTGFVRQTYRFQQQAGKDKINNELHFTILYNRHFPIQTKTKTVKLLYYFTTPWKNIASY